MDVRVYATKAFQRFVTKEGIDTSVLCRSVQRAESGLVDADLGAGLIKQRLARTNEGASGGYRTVIAYRVGRIAIFLHGFAKNERGNLSKEEVSMLRNLAKRLLAYNAEEIAVALRESVLWEVSCNEQNL